MQEGQNLKSDIIYVEETRDASSHRSLFDLDWHSSAGNSFHEANERLLSFIYYALYSAASFFIIIKKDYKQLKKCPLSLPIEISIKKTIGFTAIILKINITEPLKISRSETSIIQISSQWEKLL